MAPRLGPWATQGPVEKSYPGTTAIAPSFYPHQGKRLFCPHILPQSRGRTGRISPGHGEGRPVRLSWTHLFPAAAAEGNQLRPGHSGCGKPFLQLKCVGLQPLPVCPSFSSLNHKGPVSRCPPWEPFRRLRTDGVCPCGGRFSCHSPSSSPVHGSFSAIFSISSS